MKKLSALAAALVLLLCAFPAFAADCKDPIKSAFAYDGMTGVPAQAEWELDGTPVSQTLTGHDLPEPVVMPVSQRSFNYTPRQPGEKHMTLTVVTECGTFSRTLKYHIKQCDVVEPVIVLDKPSVLVGETFTASVDLLPGHSARWVIDGGTPSSATGNSVQITAGDAGVMSVAVLVKRGNANANTCEAFAYRTVPVTAPCTIAEPVVQLFPSVIRANQTFTFLAMPADGETVTFNVTNGAVVRTMPYSVDVLAPASGNVTIDYTLAKEGCSRTFSRTIEVAPCAPTATVSVVSQSCGANVIAIDFTGTAPFQGYWSDGTFFRTSRTHLERTVYAGGTYTVPSFRDAFCQGTTSGSATVAAALPPPVIDFEALEGGWNSSFICPNQTRQARVFNTVPSGADVVWSIENGTIVAGQGTPLVSFTGTSAGQVRLRAQFRNAECTSASSATRFLDLPAAPQLTVTVEPSTIELGETAIVTVRTNGWHSLSVWNSAGDAMAPLFTPEPYTFQYEYHSAYATGPVSINAQAWNACNVEGTASAQLTINPGQPAAATATIIQYGDNCTNWGAYAELKGVPPFSGTWSNGQSWTSDYPYVYLFPITPGSHTLTSFSDANGAGTVSGQATFDYVELPQPSFAYSTDVACPNTAVTATLTTPLPEGAIPFWEVQGGTILSGQGTASIQIMPSEYVYTTVRLTGAGCSPSATWLPLPVNTTAWPLQFEPGQVNAGDSTIFTAWGDPNIADIHFENSKGDPMEIIGRYDNSYTFRYTAANGAGDSIIRIWGTTTCGLPFEATRTLVILPARPTATLTTAQGTCSGATVTVTFSGTAPFSGTWMDGQTFTTNDFVYTREVSSNGWYWLTNFTDATGQWGGMSNQVAAIVTMPRYADSAASTTFCPGGTGSVQVFNATDGYEVVWSVGGIGRIVSGEGASLLVVTADTAGDFAVSVRLRSPEGCLGPETVYTMTAQGPISAPVITLPKTTVAPGESMDLTMEFYKWGLYTTLYWSADWPSTIEFVGAPDYGLYTLRYTAPSEPGQYTIHAVAETQCGQSFDVTAVVTVAAP